MRWLWLLLWAIAPLAIAGCEPGGELMPAPVGLKWNSDVPTSPARPLAPGAQKMLDDPDAMQEEWEGETFADSLEQATSKCRQQAENMSNRGAVVRSLGAIHVRGKYYKCRFSTEVPR